jgi:hypothetical protein
MKIGVFVLVLVIVIAAVILFINNAGVKTECKTDSDCVAKECCHPTSCIAATQKTACNVFCTEECRPGTMDCNQGKCICLAGKCSAQIKG